MSYNKDYTPETPFRKTNDSGLVYCLVQDGWRKGEPVMINEVWVSIDTRNLSDETRRAVADVIVGALNEAFPSAGDFDE